MTAFIKSLAEHVHKDGLLARDDRVVVGVSGGPDSMALLHGLAGLNQAADFELALHVAHLNHQLRGDAAERDAAFVQAAADDLNLPCTIERRDIGLLAGASSLADARGVSDDATWLGFAGPSGSRGAIEETARRERYALFERVALATGSNVICVGHQADDNAETILHRIVRGTGLRGMAGIPAVRRLRPGSDIRVVRPLLRTPRRKLMEFLADAGVRFREDETNALPAPGDVLGAFMAGGGAQRSAMAGAPLRNVIRNVLLPLLETQMNPQVREALLRLAEQARWVEEHLSEVVQRAFEGLLIRRSDRELVLNARVLARRGRIVQAEVVRHAIASFQLGEQELSFAHLAAVCELLVGRASGKQVQLPGGLTATKRYERLILALPGEAHGVAVAEEVAVHVPGRTRLADRRLELVCSIREIPGGTAEGCDAPHSAGPSGTQAGIASSRNRLEESIDYDTLRLPLCVRSRRRGERFWPLGAPGSKKISEFLVDAKVDPEERDRVAILCDQQGPVWLIGHRIDERTKLTSQTTRILHLRAHAW